MKLVAGFKNSLKGLTDAVGRYPLTAAFLIAATVVNAGSIQGRAMQGEMYGKLLLTFTMGVFLCTVAQVLHERFFAALLKRVLLAGIACLLALGYFLLIRDVSTIGTEIMVRTAAFLSALFMAIIWVPSIKSKISFNEAFMSVFKSLFISIFFAGVIFAGVSLILSAVHLLLFRISSVSYGHAANVIFIIFAPMYFLSLMPNYNAEDREEIQNAVSCPKFLDILISNIIIPLASIFTVILVLYIALNITGSFWADNLIEPMLVSYSIVVILVYILAGNLDNRLANAFKKIFPKVLIPVVLFQIVASVLKIGDVGLTYSRYYAIMYGVFAIAAGVVFSFYNKSRNGIIPAVLIFLSIISIVPPVDAFTVSKINQIGTLEKVLMRNEIMVEGQIVPKESIPSHDKIIIANTASYISMMKYAKDIAWLADDFDYYMDFEKTFGFNAYELDDMERPIFRSRYFVRNQKNAVDISGYDMMALVHIVDREPEMQEVEMNFKGVTYLMGWKAKGNGGFFYLRGKTGTDIITLDLQEIIDRFEDMQPNKEMSLEEASFTAENSRAQMKVVVNHMEAYEDGKEWQRHGEAYLFITFKDVQ